MNWLFLQLYRGIIFFYRLIHRWLTPAGSILLLAALIAGTMGIDMKTSLSHQILTLLGGVLLISSLFALRFRCPIDVDRILPRFGSVESPLTYRLVISNPSGELQTGLVFKENPRQVRMTLEDYKNARSGFRSDANSWYHPFRFLFQFKEQLLPPLLPKGRVLVSTTMVPSSRGILHFSNFSVIRKDPFGLMKAQQTFSTPQKITILPKRYKVPYLELSGNPRYQPGGIALASSIGESEEVVSLREYRQGDPIRHIHWKSWAKLGKPIIKEFQNEYFVRHALILDTFAGETDASAFEEAVSLAASFACTLETQESLLDLMFVGCKAYCFTIGRGLAHREQMLEILASVKAAPEKPFESLSQMIGQHAMGISGCIAIFLDWDSQRKALIDVLKSRGIPTKVYVIKKPIEMERLRADLTEEETAGLHFLETGQVQEGLDR